MVGYSEGKRILFHTVAPVAPQELTEQRHLWYGERNQEEDGLPDWFYRLTWGSIAP